MPANGAPAAAAPEATFEVTVDGKPTKLTRKQIEQFAGKGAFTDQVLRQSKQAIAAAKKLEAEYAERESIWDDEERLMSELEKRGKLDNIARRRLAKHVQQAEMTPEQRERQAAEDRAAAAEAKLKGIEEEHAKKSLSENAKRLQVRIEGQLAEAAERVGLPKSGDAFYAIYDALRESVELGLPFDPEQVVETAKANIDAGFKRLEQSTLKELKGQALEDRLGKTIVDELIRHRIALRRGGAVPGKAAAPAAAAQKGDGPGYLTPEQAREKIRGLGR